MFGFSGDDQKLKNPSTHCAPAVEVTPPLRNLYLGGLPYHLGASNLHLGHLECWASAKLFPVFSRYRTPDKIGIKDRVYSVQYKYVAHGLTIAHSHTGRVFSMIFTKHINVAVSSLGYTIFGAWRSMAFTRYFDVNKQGETALWQLVDQLESSQCCLGPIFLGIQWWEYIMGC